MQKSGVSASIKSISVFQISLLISMTFAIAFLLGQEIQITSAVIVGPSALITGSQAAPYSLNAISGASSLAGAATPAAAIAGTAGTAAATTAGTTVGATTGTLGIGGYGLTTSSYALGHLYVGLSHAFIVAGLVGLAARLFGADAGTANALTIASAVGILAYHGALALFGGATAVSTAAAGAITAAAGATSASAAAAAIAGTAGVPVATTAAAATAATLPGATAATVASAATAATPGVTLAGTQATASTGIFGSSLSTVAAFWWAAAIAVVAFVIFYKKVKQQLVTFQCLPWEAPIGGSKCEECNKDPFKPCSEYRCKSLGQACQLLNPNTNNAQCAWVNKGDTQSPTIVEWNEALKPINLKYTPNNALRPGARGVKIVSPEQDGCLPAFTNLQFGVTTNEPAQCKIDYNRSVDFDNMQYFFGESNYYEYNHTQKFKLPNINDADYDLSPVLQNDGTFGLFVRCRDANGNVNVDEYSINFCVAKGPDTTPPIIEGSSLVSGSAVQFGIDIVPIEIYTNEPAQCKWSINDKSFKDMENNMGCVSDASQVNANLQYTCVGALSGVQNKQENVFYFRCEDQPTKLENERNTMTQSYKLSLRGTEALSLLKLGPNGTTVIASTTAVPITLTAETDDGADNGKAFCYFSNTGDEGSFVEYYETDAIQHSQQLSLESGNYTYFTRCVDSGGNAASGNVTFSVGTDKNMPVVTRVYKVGTDALQLVTNEAAECFYSRTSCNYVTTEGLRFNYPSAGQNKLHVAAWKDNSPYYVKCRDPYGNEPSPNACNIIVSGIDLSVKAVA